MNEYPGSIKNYPHEWLILLDTLNEAELYAVDSKSIIDPVNGSSFGQFMQSLIELSDLPFIDPTPEIPLEDWAFNGVKKKKRHEIQKIVPVLKQVKDQTHYDSVVDIGGGVGHLSRVLSHYHSIASVSVDRDPEFQKIGAERLKKYRKIDGSRDVQFVNLNFGDQSDTQMELLKSIFTPRSLTLGLHTCGALANTVISESLRFKTRGLLSFGCCFHRLNPKSDYPLSNYYKNRNYLPLNLYSLSLATRSHSAMSFSDYQTKVRVKYYRYALHLFLMKNFGRNYFTEVGECNIKTYWLPFSFYIRGKCEELKLEHNFSDEDFDHFYSDLEIQKELKIMFLCNIIRWQLGRALEVYLLLDRAIYLEEQGLKVEIRQYFEEALSPRNIGILALNQN